MTTTTTEIRDAIDGYISGLSASDCATVASCGDACVRLTGRTNSGRWAFDGYRDSMGGTFAGCVATLADEPTADELEAVAERITEWIEGQ